MSKTFSNSPLLKTLGEKFKKFMFDRNNVGDNFILPEHFEIDYNFRGNQYVSGIIQAFARFGIGRDDRVIPQRYEDKMLSPYKFAKRTMEMRKYIDLFIMQNCETKQDLISFCEKLEDMSDDKRQKIYRETINRVGTSEQRALVEKVSRKDERLNKFLRFVGMSILYSIPIIFILIIVAIIGTIIYAIFVDPIVWFDVLEMLWILIFGGE